MNKWEKIKEVLESKYKTYIFWNLIPIDTILSDIKNLLEENEDSKRKAYFALRDKLWQEGNTGLSKVEIHELAKKYIFPKLIEEVDNFIEGGKEQQELSVTWLSDKGWTSFIEEFKLFCAENYNFYL